MDELKAITEYDTTQYIVIHIGDEQYGIDIKYVENIVRMQSITRVPNVQEYFRGVINLRGEVVPVMSLRRKLELDDDVITNNTRIIIIKLEANAPIGVIVDEVKEVVTLENGSVDSVSRSSKKEENSYINGIGKTGDTLISLLDLNMVISE
ncbi:MAG: purine-binding chemotaxis protein CheW [Lachnospiraceae bacterium]|nr:purine-binding chemotaxis protein CheW [Lachnospiraceae bacterium]MCR4685284.1 chemotaxis protein CheW [Lachnospiraceae bacterium]